MNKDDKKIAVLIDVENIAASLIDTILDEVSLYGTPTYKRLYGDFTKSDLASWNKKTNEYSLRQVQQGRFSTGKNSSDSSLIIDAMDILYSGNVDSFCIVSNDSDFTALAMRIMESGYDVIGMGREDNASKSFVNACAKFVYLDDDKGKKNGKSSMVKKIKLTPVPKNILDTIKTAINNTEADDEGWVRVSIVGDVLYRRHPEFDPQRYGPIQKKLSVFLDCLEGFEVKEVKTGTGKNAGTSDFYVRIKST